MFKENLQTHQKHIQKTTGKKWLRDAKQIAQEDIQLISKQKSHIFINWMKTINYQKSSQTSQVDGS